MRFLIWPLVLTSIASAALAEDQATAQAGSASASVPVGKEDPAVARARKVDQLLGQLHALPEMADGSALEAQIWEIWSRHDSPTAEVLLRESSAAIAARDFDPAEKMLSQMLETYPAYAEGWNRRASLYYLMKRYDVALLDVDHALELEPRNFGALVGKALILQAMGKSEDAIAAYKMALAINPHMPSVKAAIAEIEKNEPRI